MRIGVSKVVASLTVSRVKSSLGLRNKAGSGSQTGADPPLRKSQNSANNGAGAPIEPKTTPQSALNLAV